MKSDFFGWYLYIPVSEGSEQKAFKWVEIHDYWLLVSQRHSDYPFLSINLGSVSLKPGPRNTIELKCAGFQGEASFVFQSPNRFDILSFNSKLFSGIEAWKEYLATTVREDIHSVDCTDYSYSIIGKDCSISVVSDGVRIDCISQDSVFIPYVNIKIARALLYDKKYGCTFELIDTQDKKYSISCKSNKWMRNILSKIHYEMTLSYNQIGVEQQNFAAFMNPQIAQVSPQQMPPNNIPMQNPMYFQPYFFPAPPKPENGMFYSRGMPIQAASMNSGYQYGITVPPTVTMSYNSGQFFSIGVPNSPFQSGSFQQQVFLQPNMNMQFQNPNMQVFPPQQQQQIPIQQQFVSQNGEIPTFHPNFQSQIQQIPVQQIQQQFQMQSQQFSTPQYQPQFVNTNIQQPADQNQTIVQNNQNNNNVMNQTPQTNVEQGNIQNEDQKQPTNTEQNPQQNIGNSQRPDEENHESQQLQQMNSQEELNDHNQLETKEIEISSNIPITNAENEIVNNEIPEQRPNEDHIAEDNNQGQDEQETNNVNETEAEANQNVGEDQSEFIEEESEEINDPFDEEEFI